MANIPLLHYSDEGDCSTYIPKHTHRTMEWVLVKKGVFHAAFTGFEKLTGGEGDIFVIPCGIGHDQSEVPDGENIFVLVEGFEQESSPAPYIVHTGKDQLLMQYFEALPRLNRNASSQSETANFLLALWERMKFFAAGKKEISPRHPGLDKAVKTIRKNFTGDLAIPDLAAKSGVSQSHLNLLFRKNFGYGAVSFIRKTRLKYARELLKNPYVSIAEAAWNSGFADPNYFSRIFRKEYGLSPTEFRGEKQLDFKEAISKVPKNS